MSPAFASDKPYGGKTMKFLVQGDNIETGALLPPDAVAGVLENAIAPSLSRLAQWQSEGKLVGGVKAGRRAGCAIIEAESPEDLDRMLTSLPFWGLLTWRIEPLIPYETALATQQEVVRNIRAAAQQSQ